MVIYADHDLSGNLSFGDYVTTSDRTGVFSIFGGKSPLTMYSGKDISTGNTFDVQYEAPAGYSVINPISSIIRALETKDTSNTGDAKTAAAENKVASAIFSTAGTSVDFSKFNPYSSVSNSDEITNAIAYQKSAASVALVVDLVSAGFVELITDINNAGGSITSLTTRQVSEKVFDALADSIINGTISGGNLNVMGASSTDVSEIATKITSILTPTATTILVQVI